MSVEKECEGCGELFSCIKGQGWNNRITCYNCTDGNKKLSYRNKHLKKKYGITQFQYKQMFESQDGRCKVCDIQMNFQNGTPILNVARAGDDCCIDHCHTTGIVRGLLCFHCNTALGHMFDNKDIIKKMLDYLN